MAPRPPDRNLPPDSQAWGRSVDTRLTDLETGTQQNFQAVTNTLRGVNETLQRQGSLVQGMVTVNDQQTVTIRETSNAWDVTTFGAAITRTGSSIDVPPGSTFGLIVVSHEYSSGGVASANTYVATQTTVLGDGGYMADQPGALMTLFSGTSLFPTGYTTVLPVNFWDRAPVAAIRVDWWGATATSATVSNFTITQNVVAMFYRTPLGA